MQSGQKVSSFCHRSKLAETKLRPCTTEKNITFIGKKHDKSLRQKSCWPSHKFHYREFRSDYPDSIGIWSVVELWAESKFLRGPSFEGHDGEECEHGLGHVVKVELVVKPFPPVDAWLLTRLLIDHVHSPDTTNTLRYLLTYLQCSRQKTQKSLDIKQEANLSLG